MSQHSRDKQMESEKHLEKEETFRRRPKYQLEIQAVAALILYKSKNPSLTVGLGDLHQDVLNISEIGKENYRKYFLSRINAVPTGSIKLKPAFITKKSSCEYEKLENKPKIEIISQIKKIVSQIDFDDPQEKIYYENKICKTNLKKCELVEIHTELSQMLAIQNDISDSNDDM